MSTQSPTYRLTLWPVQLVVLVLALASAWGVLESWAAGVRQSRAPIALAARDREEAKSMVFVQLLPPDILFEVPYDSATDVPPWCAARRLRDFLPTSRSKARGSS